MVKVEAGEDLPSVTLRSVIPGLPKDPKEKALLKEDLTQLGCEGFLKKPWSLKDEEMVGELLTAQTTEWQKTVCALSTTWTAKMWAAVYGFPEGGEGMAGRTDKHAVGKFCNPINPKDGYPVTDCTNLREKDFGVPCSDLEPGASYPGHH